MIDAPEVTPVLEQLGYAAVSGSFGQPVIVQAGAGYLPLSLAPDGLPGYTEQEVIVADLARPAPQEHSPSVAPPGPGVEMVWAPTATGLIDPRPAVMVCVRDAMDRIYDHGGVFIIFSAGRCEPRCIISTVDRFGNLNAQGARPLGAHNWSLLSELQWLSVTGDTGQEMDAADNGVARQLGIDGYFGSGRFECVVAPSSPIASRWITLATSKYGDPVAGIIVPGEAESKGLIFILPRVERRADLVADLVDRVLPELRPHLFPHAEGSRWVRRAEYELPYVQELKHQIVQIEEAARVKVREREQQIATERAHHGFMHDLLTASGDDLVQAVISALKTLGFNDVRDADADAKAAGEVGPMREDVRIIDASVPILVEVKGITGKPREASSLQVTKYLAPRMREWDRTDIRGLAIINHQRNVPALERDHDHVFQADVLSTAEDQGFGLLTTWDLFRLVRGFLAHGWRHRDVAHLFVSSGRIRPVPAHYELIGLVDGYWQQASVLGLRLHSGVVQVGDRLVYELPVDFIEEVVTSMQINNRNIQEAQAGDYLGLKTVLSKAQARKGVRVYRVCREA